MGVISPGRICQEYMSLIKSLFRASYLHVVGKIYTPSERDAHTRLNSIIIRCSS
jgi:hypothetical protein